ncbi:MAG TPA: FCD domain-containing protein [Gaiellaceae bacterium]|nr:FCD domain-containing protein [Gaiellaceae bacterium]
MSAPADQSFRPIEHLRAHEHVAEQLRRQIGLRLVGPRGTLPPERELASLFGVGRATVQRAISLLEREGLVERRRGRSGGTFVVAPAGVDGPLAAALDRIRAERAGIEEALAFRATVEPAAAAEAAGVRTEEALAAAAEACAAAADAGDDDVFMEHDSAFHLALARASANRFYVEAVERTRLALADVLVALPDSAAWRAWSTSEHAAILAAVERGRPGAAHRAMQEHVRHTEASTRALLSSL